ncbi:MAG: hypothetical protein E4H05_06015 [Acidimicrobiales bacterium]|nr:MAG: hypothetical protein E4H05_06015 [Acidimicrobiales bacterium]
MCHVAPAAVERAQDVANGLDVRVGGGPTTIRPFLDADVVDDMHIVVSPITLNAGIRLWDTSADFDDRFNHEIIPSPSRVTHHLLWLRDR